MVRIKCFDISHSYLDFIKDLEKSYQFVAQDEKFDRDAPFEIPRIAKEVISIKQRLRK
jgi:hypothetical protein